MNRSSLCLALCASMVLTAPQARAADDVSFANKTVSMTIGFAAGGGVDLFGRTIAKHLARNLPGSPNVVVVNQPGAGGIVALNDWPRRADPTGLSITIGAQSQTDPDALGRTKARFDPATFNMIGGLGAYSQGLFIHKDALSRLTDKTKDPVVVGTVGSTLRGGSYQMLWGALFLGWNIRWVLGYQSTAEVRQALERGEIEMATFGASKDFEYINAIGKFVAVSQTGQVQDGKRVPRPILGNTPIFSDLVRDKISNDAARRAFAYWEDVSQVGMWVALPPTVPKLVVDAYGMAFDATIADAVYRAEYARVDPDSIVATRDDIQRLVKRLMDVSPETLKFLEAELIRQGFTPG